MTQNPIASFTATRLHALWHDVGLTATDSTDVVDASVGIKLLLEESQSYRAGALFAQLAEDPTSDCCVGWIGPPRSALDRGTSFTYDPNLTRLGAATWVYAGGAVGLGASWPFCAERGTGPPC